ncbi:MAG TPA: cytochrome c oxidase subunit II [Polyangiaceae bacterium]
MNETLRRLLFLPLQRSTVAYEIDRLHYFVISVTLVGSVLVFLLATIFTIRYRHPPEEPATPNVQAGYHSPAILLEIVILAGLLLLFLTWWVIGSRQFVRLRVAPDDALEVYVTAKQWMWKFAYPNGKRAISTMYVPARRPIKLIMTSRDVIHSFYVPDFRIKQDVVPGRYTTVWFQTTEPGTYQILCAEYCGTAHSAMRGEVIALEPSDYERWLAERPFESGPAGEAYVEPYTPEEGPRPQMINLVNEGQRAAAEHGCLRCHSTDGSAHIGPTWGGLFGSTVPLAGERQTIADEAYITQSMMDPTAKIHRGYLPVMPTFLGRIRPTETAAIVEFIKSLRNVPRQGPEGEDPGPVQGRITP